MGSSQARAVASAVEGGSNASTRRDLEAHRCCGIVVHKDGCLVAATLLTQSGFPGADDGLRSVCDLKLGEDT